MGKHVVTNTKQYRRGMAGKAFGLLLICFGAVILAKLFYGDALSSQSQAKLQEEWKRSAGTHATEKSSSTTQPPARTPVVSEKGSKTGDTSSSEEGAELPTIIRESSKDADKPKRPSQIKFYSAFARIVIPRIKLDEIVVEGVDSKALDMGPGHMEETSWPGEVGNMVISGHRVTHSRPFYYLDEVKIGDPIYIYTKSQKFTYNVVETKVVKPTDISVIKPTKHRVLTLTTCNPRFSARTRLVVIAKMYKGPE